MGWMMANASEIFAIRSGEWVRRDAHFRENDRQASVCQLAAVPVGQRAVGVRKYLRRCRQSQAYQRFDL